MREFDFRFDDRKEYQDIYIFVVYDWCGNDYDTYKMSVISCTPFFSKEEAEEYKKKFDRAKYGDCETMIVKRF